MVAVPVPVVGAAALGRGERLLAAAHLVAGGWALATTSRLVLVDDEAVPPGGDPPADRFAWTDVASAALEGESGVLEVSLVDGSRRALLLGRGQGDRLSRVVRERVQHSVLLSRTVELRGRTWVRVAARRGADGEAFVQVVPGPGVDLRGPDVAAAVAEAEASLRDQVGLPPSPA